MKILLINGANLNMLGTREPKKYGKTTLKDIEYIVTNRGKELGVEIEAFQSNHEGKIVEKIQAAKGKINRYHSAPIAPKNVLPFCILV